MSESKTIKITYKQASEIADGIQALDATDKEKGKPLYKLDQAVKLSFAAKKRTISGFVEDLSTQRTDLMKTHEITGGTDEKGKPIDDAENVKAFNAAWEKLIKTEVETPFVFRPIDVTTELKLDTNQIPIWVITALDLILCGLPNEGADEKKAKTPASEE
jgi:hypothetical protein